ncbi:MAG: hypothetical protein ABIQ40_03470 [Bacteroidia bacterium]
MRFKFLSIVIFLTLLFQQPANSCSCIGEISVKDEIKRSDIVFTGKVISVDTLLIFTEPGSMFKVYKRKYSFQLQSLYKGKISSDTVEIIAGLGGGDCGFEFAAGSEYIVYANYETYTIAGGTSLSCLSTNICRRTCLKNIEELKQIEKQKKAKPK